MNPFKKLLITILNLGNYVYNFVFLKYKGVQYKTYPKIHGKIFLSGSGIIKLGSEVRINSSLGSNPIGGDQRTILWVSSNGLLEIDDYTGFSNITIVCQTRVKIGKYVKIGGSVKIYDTDFHSIQPEARKNHESDIPISKPVVIEDNCFIGAHSIILKGVTIGANSIIGAGSVVAKSIPSSEIWAGNPAKFIRKL